MVVVLAVAVAVSVAVVRIGALAFVPAIAGAAPNGVEGMLALSNFFRRRSPDMPGFFFVSRVTKILTWVQVARFVAASHVQP